MQSPILRIFDHEQGEAIGAAFHQLALDLAVILTDHPAELATALRKLFEARDTAVLAVLP